MQGLLLTWEALKETAQWLAPLLISALAFYRTIYRDKKADGENDHNKLRGEIKEVEIKLEKFQTETDKKIKAMGRELTATLSEHSTNIIREIKTRDEYNSSDHKNIRDEQAEVIRHLSNLVQSVDSNVKILLEKLK